MSELPRREFLRRLGAAALVPLVRPAVASMPARPPSRLTVPAAPLSRAGAAAREPVEGMPLRIGAWQPPRSIDSIARLEAALGRPFDIIHWYQGWGEDIAAFDATYARAVASHGSVPLLTWEPWDYRGGREQPQFSLRRIADGRFDGFVRRWARSLRDFETPVMLRFAHEMNGNAYPWSLGAGGSQAADYVAAWRRVVDLFRTEGAANVSWVWCPLVPSAGSPSLDDCYPGDDYVDVIGLDGYNAGTAAAWGGWLSFSEVFGPLYEQVTSISNRPVIVVETACAEVGGSKPRWITSAFQHEIPERFPDIEAVVWFNERREADWRLESSKASLAAARSSFAGHHRPDPAT